jgi:hypothetical protein
LRIKEEETRVTLHAHDDDDDDDGDCESKYNEITKYKLSTELCYLYFFKDVRQVICNRYGHTGLFRGGGGVLWFTQVL